MSVFSIAIISKSFFSSMIYIAFINYLILLLNFQVTIVRSRDKLENVLRHYLIEDRSGNGAASYVDYLCHLHKEIRALLS